VTDDFVTALYQDMAFGTRLQSASECWFRRAVAYAAGRAAVSPLMAEEFEYRYGGRWSWYTTLIDPDAYDASPRAEDGVAHLVYAGSLGLQRWQSLRELALALGALKAEKHIAAELSIFAPHAQLSAYARHLEFPATKLRGWTPPERLPALFHNADLLVHVEAFDPGLADYTRLSFSTKISQYMMAGRCILGIGPAGGGSMRMIRGTGAGVTIDSPDAATLKAPLADLLLDSARRRRCAQSGRLWAQTWVDRAQAQERFYHELRCAADNSRRTMADLPFRPAGDIVEGAQRPPLDAWDVHNYPQA
jgi:glycosyltransferase involved in cell wall biosynthesis